MKCVEQVCLPKHYNKLKRPGAETSDDPVEVMLSFNGVHIIKVDDVEFSITLQMTLRIHWTEPRLIVLNMTTEGIKTPVDTSILEYLWFTEFYI